MGRGAEYVLDVWRQRAGRATPFFSCGLDAGWRLTRRTHVGYLSEERAAGGSPSILFSADGAHGLRLECVMIDVLHAVDQGIASHIIGSVFWLFVLRKVWGRLTQEQSVQELFKDMQQHYQDNKSKSRLQGTLSVERIKTGKDWPTIKAKAASTRHLATFALHLALRYGTDGDECVIAVCQLLCRF